MPAGPRFVRWFWPVVEALNEIGGSAAPAEVVDLVLDRAEVTETEKVERTDGGSLRLSTEVHWARQYLVWGGYLDGSVRGRWTLTESGASLTPQDRTYEKAYELFRIEHARHAGTGKKASGRPDDAQEDLLDDEDLEEFDEEVALKAAMREAVLTLDHAGFERLAKRLLTELGLVKLRNTGGSGDRGIDITGRLRLNAVVNWRVGVQCKQYSSGTVSPREIREFQGALGPFDRGIFITTTTFTSGAEEQADAPGYKPVDLIDSEELLDLLITNRLGVKQVDVVDEDFFALFSRAAEAAGDLESAAP